MVTGVQVVAVKLLPALAPCGVQLATGVGPVLTLLQVVMVKLLPALAPDAVQDAT